jgi:antitoxin component YwqK of YwqJK toxin-antitoxin module
MEKKHREDGPAFLHYYKNGNICTESYYINGKLHRKDGPAWIKYDGNRRIEFEDYYLNGVQYFKKDYLEKIKQLNSCNKMS